MYDAADIGILVGVLAVALLALFLWLLSRFAAISENLYFRLNNRLERDNHLIRDGNKHQLYRHYGWAAKLRVLISNREASGYLSIGIAMSVLFGFAFIHMTLKGYGSVGHIYSVSTYLWMFAMSLDDVPRLVEQYSNLKISDNALNSQKKTIFPRPSETLTHYQDIL